jgi:hypothetical protein
MAASSNRRRRIRLLQHTGPAPVFRDYGSKCASIIPGCGHGGSRLGAARRRAAGRAGNARMGHASDSQAAAEGRRSRHGPHLRCPDVGNELRHLCPPCLTRSGRGRSDRAGSRRRPHRTGRARGAASFAGQ